MSELISGKEAMCKAIEGEDVLFKYKPQDKWLSFNSEAWEVSELVGDFYEFRLKPQTITVNGVELEKPKSIEKPTDTSILLCFNSKSDRNVFINTLMNRNF